MKLKDKISLDIRQRLARGDDSFIHKTIDELASHYNTSITPVRQALEQMREEGLLDRNQSKHHSLEVGTHLSSQNHSTLGSAEVKIKNEVIAYSFQGESFYLREIPLCEKYRISRYKLRRLMEELCVGGLIHKVPRCGWKIRPFSAEDYLQFLAVRERLECLALDIAFEKLDAASIEIHLQKNVLPDSSDGKILLNNDFHNLFIHLSSNSYIKDFFNRHSPYFYLVSKNENRRENILESCEYHVEILNSILHKNKKQALRSLAEHIRSGKSLLDHL